MVVSTTANKTSLDDGSAEFALADANGTEIKSVSAENCVVSGERFHDIKQPPQKMNICDGRFCL